MLEKFLQDRVASLDFFTFFISSVKSQVFLSKKDREDEEVRHYCGTHT